jgi:hypothetical protein
MPIPIDDTEKHKLLYRTTKEWASLLCTRPVANENGNNPKSAQAKMIELFSIRDSFIRARPG